MSGRNPLVPLILGHRGYSAKFLENSMQAFDGALAAGMDGFELDVQPSRDGVCFVLHDDDLGRTARSPGILRAKNSTELPRLKNGEPVPRLEDALRLPARLVNVELKGRPGWRPALNVVERVSALERVIFSSFEHEEIFELKAARPSACCGLLWEAADANSLSGCEVENLATAFTLHVPLCALRRRPEFWSRYATRLAIWGMERASEASLLPFTPAVIIADSP